MSDCLILPAEVREDAENWLDELEAKVAVVEDASNRLSGSELSTLREAIADVRTNMSFARAAFLGLVAPTESPPGFCPIPSRPSPELAALIHGIGDALGGTPWPMIARAKLALDASQHRPFLTVVGTVLASVFTSLTQGVWNNYPEYAPKGWSQPSPPEE